jgi:hypothetical protein
MNMVWELKKLRTNSIVFMRKILAISLLLISIVSEVRAGEVTSAASGLGETAVFTCVGRDCVDGRKRIHTSDIAEAFSDIFRAKMYYMDRRTYPPDEVSYVELVENDYFQIISYHEFKKGKWNLSRSFYCDIRRLHYDAWCEKQIYYVNGKEVDFNDSLIGKDPVYDWVKSHIPDDRRQMHLVKE